MITQEELKSKYHYDSETGIFTKIKTGKVMGSFDITTGYIKIMFNRQRFAFHRLAWFYVHGVWPKEQIDHINGIRHDNRLCNLREANYHQNALNRKKLDFTKSKSKNVNYHNQSGKWRVRCTIDGIRKSFGLFQNLELAELVANEIMEKHYGEFARS
jgi:hypothetical protein